MIFSTLLIPFLFSFFQPDIHLQYPDESIGPKIVFAQTRLKSDTICEGEQYKFIYQFKNAGDQPLILSNVRSSCGCYVPRWPREPVLPGDSSEIIGTYSSRGRPGPFTKSMTVNSNDSANQTIVLMCKGYTKPRELYQKKKHYWSKLKNALQLCI